jgi:hypothetical protein
MKRTNTVVCLTAALLLLARVPAKAENPPPGQVDFGSFAAPSNGGEFVEVNLPGSLISLASRFLEKQEPEVAKLLNGLKLVRVNVVRIDDQNREDIEKRIQRVKTDLSGKGWNRLVTAQKQKQDVGVYLKTGENDAIQGLALVVNEESKQAVFVNVVGDIRPEQLSILGDRLNIEPLKKISPETTKAEDSEK